jgi:hypothetical protein
MNQRTKAEQVDKKDQKATHGDKLEHAVDKAAAGAKQPQRPTRPEDTKGDEIME